MKGISLLTLLLILSITILFHLQLKENFDIRIPNIKPTDEDRDVQIYSNYVKDGAYKEVKFNLNIHPILPEKNITIDDWRFKTHTQQSIP